MEESRRLLEACVNEFFDPITTNERKREIEGMLNSFSKLPGSWKQALYCLAHSLHNQFMLMYCVSVIENTVKCQWNSMIESEQTELKTNLSGFLIQYSTKSSQQKCPNFVRSKIVKVLTDIGKFSWPQSYPDFFTNILEISESSDTVTLGVLFLKIISEEWSNLKDDVSTFRKTELKIRLLPELFNIFNMFQRILEAGLNQIKAHQVTSNPSSDMAAHSSPSLVNSELIEVVLLVLETSAHFSSWIPLDGIITSMSTSIPKSVVDKWPPYPVEFVRLVCQYAVLDTPSSPRLPGTTALSMEALRVLNEILYRKFIPKEFEEQLTFIVRFGVDLLNHVLNKPSVSSLEEDYLEKVIEFLRLVVSSHFNRYDEQTAKAFMSLLLPFTFKQEDCSLYYECLEIWAGLLDNLSGQILVNMTSSREDFLSKYKQPIWALVSGILHSTLKFKIQLTNNSLEMEDDENAETPSLVRNVDILVKVGDLLPTESLESLTSTWSDTCRFFLNLQSALDPTMATLKVENPVEIDHFNFVVQMIGRMANIFYDGDVFKQELTLGKTLYQQLVSVYCFSKQFYMVRDPAIVVKSNCEIVYSLRTWTFWLSRFHSEIVLCESTLADQQLFFELLSSLIDVVFFTLENRARIDPTIITANVNMFTTLVNVIRTQYIFQMPSVQALIQQIYHIKNSTAREDYRTLSRAVASVLLLPWQSVSQQEWEMRTQIYTSHMKVLLQELGQANSNPQVIIESLVILNDQLDLLLTECSNSKKICWNVIKEVVPFLQKITATYLRQPDVSEQILLFFLKIMEVLRQQSGAQFFEETIRGFLSLFSSENLINDLLRETESSSVVVAKFLQMLQFMVKDPSPSFRKFLPEALSICYDHVYPVLAQRSTPDLKIPFFQLIRDTLTYRWNYFFPTLLLLQNSAPNSRNQVDPSVSKRLDEILQSIGHSFLQPDLEIFRFNLGTLTAWNEKHGLYQKLSSHDRIIEQFMTVLLQVLVQKSHDLLRDELARVLHEMSSIDFPRFRNNFLSDFLQTSLPSMSQDQKQSLCHKFSPVGEPLGGGYNNNENCDKIDFPSFALQLNNFLEDFRYFYFLAECERANQVQSPDRTQGTSDV